MPRALVVDGDPRRGSATRELLSELRFDVILVEDAIDACEVLRMQGRPALVITELVLPRGDGISFLRRVRGLSSGSEPLRIVVLSASREAREKAAQLRDELGIDAILSTAASPASLRRVLGAVAATATGGRRTDRPAQKTVRAVPTLASLALDVGSDFGLTGLQVATGAVAPVSRYVTPLVASDQRVLGQLYVECAARPVDRDTLEIIAREVVREFESAHMGRGIAGSGGQREVA